MSKLYNLLRLLIHKNYLVRKQQWMQCFLSEMLLPLLLVGMAWKSRGIATSPPVTLETTTYYNRTQLSKLSDNVQFDNVIIYYSPNNTCTATLVEEAFGYSKDNSVFTNFNITGFATEEELLLAYKLHQMQNDQRLVIGVVFEKELDDHTVELKYKIRTEHLNEMPLFNILLPRDMFLEYTNSLFAQTQIYLDIALISRYSKDSDFDPQVSIQRMPELAHVQPDPNDKILREFILTNLMTTFLIPLIVESINISNEKSSGIGVLMSMYGASNKLNLFGWLITSALFTIVFCAFPVFILLLIPTDNAPPFINYGNPFIFWLIITLHVFHLLSYGIHVSAYITKPLYVAIVLLILNMGYNASQLIIKKSTLPAVPYLGILFPHMLLYRAVTELNYYEILGEGSHWYNLFKIGDYNYKFAGCIGMILIFTMLGTIFHFSMGVYIYNINIEKCGVKKDILFFLRKNNDKFEDNLENLEGNTDNDRLFELIPQGIYNPGIRIRNLKKSYESGGFNKTEVEALRGISIDFQKGQITTLLGHNGAGKTTILSILSGVMSPSSGSIYVDSKNLKENLKEIMKATVLCPQENILFPHLPVEQQLEFFAKLKEDVKTKAEIKVDVKTFLEKLNLYHKRNVLPEKLSDDEKRRVCLGMALVGDSSILLLDEPTSGLNPKNKRIIWDSLLKLRGQKTILISTYDTEEADILGDKIAILHQGELKSYGSTVFLKKIIGEGNLQVTLSIEPWCDIKKVCQDLNCEEKDMIRDGSKLVLNIPNSQDVPESLDNLEIRKKNLGVLELSVAVIGLEEVFLKVTQEDSEPVNDLLFTRTAQKVTGTDLTLQSIQALLHKKLIYTLKNISVILTMLLLVFIGLLFISVTLKETNVSKEAISIVNIKLDMYNNPETYYKILYKDIGKRYKSITEKSKGRAHEVQGFDVSKELLIYAEVERGYFDTHVIAATEINETMSRMVVNAMYSQKLSYSIPISINLLSNAMIKSLASDDYSISVSSQQFPSKSSMTYPEISKLNAVVTSVIFSFIFFSMSALFVFHPTEEFSSGIKHLQRMARVSSSVYWGTMFIFDLIIFLLIIILIVIGFTTMDYILDLKIYGSQEILILLLCFVIFAINVLPVIYIFSFLNVSSMTMIQILCSVPMGLVVFETILSSIKTTLEAYKLLKYLRNVQKYLFLFVPYVSFFHGQLSFYTTAQNNARCKKIPNEFYHLNCGTWRSDVCCALDCHDGVCENPLEYFTNYENDITLESSLIYLFITPVIYFGILGILEYALVQKFLMRYKTCVLPDYSPDEQVKNEKLLIERRINTISKGSRHHLTDNLTDEANGKLDIQSTLPENSTYTSYLNYEVFLAYALRKSYGKLLAVKDVSFRVTQSQCFGLLGVNNAGKTTTFKMMTGETMPDFGFLYINEKEINTDRQYYLSQIGYCPQNSSLIETLNAYEHLRLFAYLRGIPQVQIESEVDVWINRLNLNAWASQDSGTYTDTNKRRLNLAIALIGIPSLVLLDEPTTGVDPGARRSLWNIIQSYQKTGQAVVLTSHSVEECEILCNRIATMVAGRLVSIGPCEELKQRFGAGFDIKIKMNPEHAKNQVILLKTDIVKLLDCKLVDENASYLIYHVTRNEASTWKMMYSTMDELKTKYECIDDYSVITSSLERLFLLFAQTVID